jgi:hypothetical protein
MDANGKIPKWSLIAIAAATVWLALAVAAYYVPHKPFDLALVIILGRSLLDILIAFSVLSVAGGLGRRIFPAPHHVPLVSFGIQAGIGFLLLSLAIFVSGLFGLFQIWFAWLALLVLILIFRQSIREWISQLDALRFHFRKASRFSRWIAIFSAILVLPGLLDALAPPLKFDALVYHLQLPRDFLSAGKLVFVPENTFWGMPLAVEMLFTWVMALGRVQSAAVLGWFAGITTLITMIGFGSQWKGRVAWLSAAVLLAGNTLSASLGWAYVDWWSALAGIGLVASLDNLSEDQGWKQIFLVGLLAGFAISIKLSAGAVVPAALIALTLHKPAKLIKSSLILLTGVMLISIPWFLKNLVYTGALLYPFFGTSQWIDPIRQAFYNKPPLKVTYFERVFTPFFASILGAEGAPGYSASIGPLMIGLIPGCFFVKRWSQKSVRSIAAFLLVGWIVWSGAGLIGGHLSQSRLYYVFFPAWAILAAIGFEGLASIRIGQVRFQSLASVLVLIVLTLSSIAALQQIAEGRALGVLMNVETPSDYVGRRLGSYGPAMESVAALDQEASVLMLWETRGFYCAPKCIADVWIDRWYVDRRAYTDADQIFASWIDQGFTHVLLHRAGMEFIQRIDRRYNERDWSVLQQLLSRLESDQVFGEGHQLYRLVP